MATDETFLGVGWGFPPTFSLRGKSAVMVSAEEDIRQSLHILMTTTPGERVMQPNYGCDLRHLVFEVINQSTATDIKDTIERAVRLYEARVTLEDVSIDTSDWIDGVLKVRLVYTIIQTNTRNNLVFPLYLLEGTSAGFQA